jgi:hypothetical protein
MPRAAFAGGTIPGITGIRRPLGGDQRRRNLRLDWRGRLERTMAGRRAEDLNKLEPDADYRKLGDEGAG